MKKVLSILLAVCLVVAAVPLSAVHAAGANVVLSESFGEGTKIEKYNGTNANLTNGVTSNPENWYAIDTPDGTSPIWAAPTLENGALRIQTAAGSKKTIFHKKFGESSVAKSGDEFYVTFKAKAAVANSVYFSITNVKNAGSEYDARVAVSVSQSADFKEYSGKITLSRNCPQNECFVFSGYVPAVNADITIDDIVVKKVVPATNSGLIMDGDFEATEQLTAYGNGINNLTNGKWYASSTGAVSVKSDEEHGNYAALSANKGGRLVQNLPAAKLDESVVITFKARSTNASKLMYFYVVPSAAINGYAGRVCREIATEWTEYTMIFNPMGTEAESNVLITPLASGDYSGQNVIFEIYNPAGNGCDLEIDDIRIEKADPFASNDLGQAELTGVSMRGANGTLPTAIRWKNAITKTFAENGVGDFNEVIEYGALVANTSTLEANNEKLTENATSAKIKGVAYNATTSKLFAETEEYNIFSLALSGITTENYGKALTVRPYVKISNGQKIITVYGESRSNSLFDACHAVLSGTNETDIALVKGILTETDDVKQAYLEVYPGDSEKLQ